MTLYLIFIIVGALLLAGACVSLKNKISFLRNGERAPGTLVRYTETEDDGSTYYYPVFEITTKDQTVITYKHSTATSSPRWKPNDKKAFIFIPGKPETLRMLRFGAIFWWPLSLMILAIELLSIGGCYFLMQGYFK